MQEIFLQERTQSLTIRDHFNYSLMCSQSYSGVGSQYRANKPAEGKPALRRLLTPREILIVGTRIFDRVYFALEAPISFTGDDLRPRQLSLHILPYSA
jgi:hypothetical protein